MKYMLMMTCPKSGYETFGAWPQEDLQAHIRFMVAFSRSLKEAGVLVASEGLASPAEAKRVRAAADGTALVDSGFAEAKEYLSGFWIVEVQSATEAYTIAARASAAPGKGGVPMNMPIEVRQIPAGPPQDLR